MALEKKPCPQCRKQGGDTSGDNLVVYPEGCGAHCFACGYHEHGKSGGGKATKTGAKLKNPVMGKVCPLKSRKIDERTCKLYGYRLAKFKTNPNGSLGKYNGTTVHVSDYWKDGVLTAQHLRFQNPKAFRWTGDADIETMPLYGQWLWSGSGKRIVVTEGEIDCLTISMLWKNRWPVVSLPSGVQSSEASIRANLAFLSGYDEIVLCFDNDEQGRTYAEKCAEILPPGKVKIAHLPMKDANDMHRANQGADVLKAIYEARSFQPDGILHAGDVVDTPRGSQKQWTYPWTCLTRGLMGQRSGEITMWVGGTGSGKSTMMRENVYHHLLRGRKVGVLMLEESPTETLDDLVSLHISKPVRQIRAGRELNELIEAEGGEPLDFGYPDTLTDEEYAEAREFFKQTSLYIYDHHGSNEFSNVLQRVEYMAAGLGCEIIVVDHVTAVVAGMDHNGSERECIDEIMRTLRSITERTGTHIDIVSQLNRLEGKAAEDGAQISIKNLRGSGSLGSVPNTVLAIERDQQAEDPNARNTIRCRVLKGRFTGSTGIVGALRHNSQTWRLTEVDLSQIGDNDDEESGFQPEVGDAESVEDSGGEPSGDAGEDSGSNRLDELDTFLEFGGQRLPG